MTPQYLGYKTLEGRREESVAISGNSFWLQVEFGMTKIKENLILILEKFKYFPLRCMRSAIEIFSTFLLMPPGAMSLKIQVVSFFFSVKNVHFNWIIGFSGTRDVFLSRANSTARCRQCFVAEFFQVYIVFLVVAIFAKTECYSRSNLLVRSAMCRTSATYQLSTCRKWYVHHSKHSMIILVTKPISITPVLSLARKASEKILPVKTITQGKSKPLVESIFRINRHTGAWVHW